VDQSGTPGPRRAAPRSAELDALLRDLDQLRRTLETDLSVAAAAVEAGSVDVAVDVLEHDQQALGVFSGRAGQHLRPARRPGLRRLLTTSAGPIGLAAAAAAVVAIAVLAPGQRTPSGPDVAAGPSETQSATLTASLTALAMPYQALVELSDENAPDHQVRAAAGRLDAGVRQAQPQLRADPLAATAALGMLQAEHQVLKARDTAGSMSDLVQRNQQLSQQIRDQLPPGTVLPSPDPSNPVIPLPTTSAPVQPTEPPVTEPPPTTEPTAAPQPTETPTGDPSPPAPLVALFNQLAQAGTAPDAPSGQP
jgi:hypothetical protein